MDYYIQGDAANADKINAAFEKLGYDTTGHLFNAKSVLYFTLDGGIRATTCNCTPAIIKTHPDYKELELPIEPKFKVGDKIQAKDSKMYVYTVLSVDLQNQKYLVEHNYKHQILFTKQDNFELVPLKPHYDIANFKPFDKVLVRCSNDEEWMIEFYCKYDTLVHTSPHRDYPFMGIGDSYSQCIPYNDDTKHLLGTTGMCAEEFINWVI